MSLAEYSKERRRLSSLEKANRRLLSKLEQTKEAKAELIKALHSAASDAFSTLEIAPVAPPRQDKRSKQGETLVAMYSDLQLGKRTPTYNSGVAARRSAAYAQKLLSFAELQRSHHPVRDVRVWLLGDIVEGEIIFPNQAYKIDASLFSQVRNGVQIVSDFLRTLLTGFEEVHVVGVIGNHGRLGTRKLDYNPETNADRLLYSFTKDLLQDPRLSWHIPYERNERAWYAVDRIGRYSCLLFHGDQVRTTQGFPWYGFHKKVLGWKAGAIKETFKDAACVSADTEALTDRGWTTYDQIRSGDRLATLNPETKSFEWQTPSRILSYEYDGNLIHHKSPRIDHLATSDHDMWVGRAGVWKRRKAPEVRNGNWRLQHAAERWKGQEHWFGPVSGDFLDCAELVGWFVSEGSALKHQLSIAQSRKANLGNYDRIAALLERLGMRVSYDPLKLRVCSTEAAKWFAAEFGVGRKNKQLPRWVKEWPVEALERMVGAMILGDGHARNNVADYYTTSQQLADDLQEVALKIGRGTSTRVRSRENRLPCYEVTLIDRAVRTAPRQGYTEIPYRGIVWCPTLPNGLWFARRNGKVVVTGNSGHWHTSTKITFSDMTVRVNGSFESTNTWAQEQFASMNSPSQTCFFVRPDKGIVTAEYEVRL